MTELSPVGTMTPHSDEVKGSCGLVLPNAKVCTIILSCLRKKYPGTSAGFWLYTLTEGLGSLFLKVFLKLIFV